MGWVRDSANEGEQGSSEKGSLLPKGRGRRVDLRHRSSACIRLVSVFTIPKVLGEIVWLDAGSRGSMVLEGITTGMLIMLLLPAALALWNDKIRAKAGKAAKKLAFLLPSTKDERRCWWAVCHASRLEFAGKSCIADF